MTAHGLRLNNAGNIRYVENVTSIFKGCTGQDDAGFCIFDTPVNGIRALAKTLRNYQLLHKINTVAEAITRWAPPSENDTAAYIVDVCEQTGYKAMQVLNLSNVGVLTALTKAIIKHENGSQPYSSAQIAAGVNQAIGVKG